MTLDGSLATNVAQASITFTAGGSGAATTVTSIFTTTGGILVLAIAALCLIDLTESAGTPDVALGVTSGTADFIAATTATAIDAGTLWVDTGPDADSVPLPAAMKDILIQEDVIITIGGTNNVSAGQIDFVVLYVPIGGLSTLTGVIVTS